MKAELEGQHLQTACWGHHSSLRRGILLVSETQEEKEVLDSLWLDGAGPVAYFRYDDGTVQLVMAPTDREGEAR